jgi:hypothetical protein
MTIRTKRGARKHAAPVKMRMTESVLIANEAVDERAAEDDISRV